MRFADTREQRIEPERPPLTGDAAALARLFSVLPQGLPHGANWGRQAKRVRRRGGPVVVLAYGRGEHAHYNVEQGPDGRRYAEWKERTSERFADRFGIVEGDKVEVADYRRKLRNARKRDRQASR